MDSQVIGFSADSQADQQGRWPLWSGAIPALAENYCLRPETGIGPADSLLAGDVLILADAGAAEEPGTAPGAGTGKTQLAAAAARDLLRSRAIEVLIWVNASSRDAVLTGYAQALADLKIAEVSHGVEPAAAAMLEWLASSARRWLVVLDGVVEPRDLEGLLPQGAGRRVLVTMRGTGAGFSRESGRLRQIGPLSHREAVNFLTAGLKDDPDLRLGAPDLADDLAGLPIGLELAAAVMLGRRLDCRAYRAVFTERRQRFAGAWGSSGPIRCWWPGRWRSTGPARSFLAALPGRSWRSWRCSIPTASRRRPDERRRVRIRHRSAGSRSGGGADGGQGCADRAGPARADDG